MCFSATASFGSGAFLSASGAVSSRLPHKKTERLLALVPIFFGVQQLFEGVVWLGIHDPQPWLPIAAYGFLFFSHVFWPAFMPLVYVPFENGFKRKVFQALSVLGIVVALYGLWYLWVTPLAISTPGGHLQYHAGRSYSLWMLGAYVITTTMMGWFSSSKTVQGFLFFVSVGLVVALYSAVQSFPSVWCFFAALSSLFLVYAFSQRPDWLN